MNNPRKIFRQFTDEKLEQVRNHPYFAAAKVALLNKADGMLENEPPRIRFSKIHLYVTTGDRATFENDFFHYFDRVRTMYLAYLITEEEKYLTELGDTIWNICNFESWTLPAHISEGAPIHRRRNFIALFSAAAGATLSEILYFVGDKLPELVTRRAKAEIQYRTIDSFANNDCPFEHVSHNWAAVCISSVLCTYLYMATEEEIEAQLPRMMATADRYLTGFADDGCCSEGISYWGYGFSNFITFAAMLKDYTDGKINYFENPKVKKVAWFPYRVRLNDNDSLSFSDGGGIGYKVDKAVAHVLKENYPDYPILENEPLVNAPGSSRGFFCVNPDYVAAPVAPKSEIFDNVQWFVHHSKSYAVGAKAGHNDEFHNHNDVGSFSVSKDGVVAFTDLGAGTYTKQYFAAETRYRDHMICASRGHSAPIINGLEQVEGNRGICDLHTLTEDRFTFDMKKAYVIDTLESLVRDFDCNEEYFTLTDTYTFTETPTALVERFVSRLPVTYEDGVVKSGNTIIEFNADEFDVNVANAPAGGVTKRVIYYVDFTPKTLNKNMTFTFKFI